MFRSATRSTTSGLATKNRLRKVLQQLSSAFASLRRKARTDRRSRARAAVRRLGSGVLRIALTGSSHPPGQWSTRSPIYKSFVNGLAPTRWRRHGSAFIWRSSYLPGSMVERCGRNSDRRSMSHVTSELAAVKRVGVFEGRADGFSSVFGSDGSTRICPDERARYHARLPHILTSRRLVSECSAIPKLIDNTHNRDSDFETCLRRHCIGIGEIFREPRTILYGGLSWIGEGYFSLSAGGLPWPSPR